MKKQRFLLQIDVFSIILFSGSSHKKQKGSFPMKKLISVFLVLALVFAAAGTTALAASSKFDRSIFENSTKFSKDGFGWKLIGGYVERFNEGTVSVRAMLFDNYIKQGWGPELRVEFYNPGIRDYEEVTAFRANVDDVLYSFDNLEYNDAEDVHGGSVFGGTVYPAFLQAIIDAKNVAFQIEYEDMYGRTNTLTIEHVHTGDLSELKDMATYLFRSKAFSVDTDPEGNDKYYGASIS